MIGEQSAGKSSLLENISGIQFPRAQNTCTRMPCVVTMLTNPALKQPTVEVSKDPSFQKAPVMHSGQMLPSKGRGIRML